MAEYNNLPGVFARKKDGNLAVQTIIPGNTTLIFGTAPNGPFNQFYFVSDTAVAERIFDPTGSKEGDLLKGMYEALQGGAQYVALCRIGASGAKLDYLNGWTIETNDSYSDVGGDYRVYYNFVSSTGVHTLKIYSASSGELIWSNDGSVDSSAVKVSFSGTIYSSNITVGSDGTGVALNSASAEVGMAASVTLEAGVGSNGIPTSGFITGTPNDELPPRIDLPVTDLDLTVKPGMKITLGGTGGGAGDLTDYLVAYSDATNNQIYLSHKWNSTTSAWDAWAPLAKTGEGSWTGFAGASTTSTTVTIKSTFHKEVIGTSMSLTERYQALERAYREMETAKVDMVIPQGVYLDSPNIIVSNGTSVSTPSVSDFLGKAYKFEHNGEIFFYWAMNSSDISANDATKVPTPYEVGISDPVVAKKLLLGKWSYADMVSATASPAESLALYEVNFAHQVAEYLHRLSVNDNEASATIGVVPPSYTNKASLNNWLGSLPTYNAAGAITASGTGILGNKIRVGALSVSRGLFHTSNGLYGGTVALDAENQAIDIGRYVDLVATPVRVINSFDNSSSGYVTSGAGVYGGLIMSLSLREAPTRKKFGNSVRPAFSLHKDQLNSVVGVGYVAFDTDSTSTLYVVDAPTGALPTSDWKRRMTCRQAARVIEILRDIADPYLGSITSGVIRNALEENGNVALQKLADPVFGLGIDRRSSWTVRATREQELAGEAIAQLSLVVPGELRRIIMYINLSK